MDGILLIDKPKGWTSFDVVHKVRRIVQQSPLNNSQKKRFPVGHTGTLDPMATGLLVLLLGNYTRHAMSLTKLDKIYQTSMVLGTKSSTGDEEGEKTFISDHQPQVADIQTALEGFVGESMQMPPAYSAIKINGQRAYKLAREGKIPDLVPRPIYIRSIAFKSYEYPVVTFDVHVSSGTYIRSLVEDIGKELGTGAYMNGLRRTVVGKFDIKDALTVENLSDEVIASALRELPA